MTQAINALLMRGTPEAVRRLEAAAGKDLGVEVVAFGSARAALATVLKALAEPGARVLVPAYTCVAVPNAVQTAGHPVTWVDIDGPNIDLERVAAVGRPGDVVIAQHTYGVPVDPAGIAELRRRGLVVIEDRAHRFDGLDLAGQAAVFSLEHSKVISGGRGGLAWVEDPSIAARLRSARDDGLTVPASRDVHRILRTSAIQRLLASRLVPRPIGSIGRRLALRMAVFSEPGQSQAEIAGGDVDLVALHPALAAAARPGVERAAANRSHRLWAVERYVERLGDLVPAWAFAGRPYVRMPIVVDDAAPVTARLRAAGLDPGPRWFDAPVHPTGSRSSYVPGSAPIAELLSRRILSLPTHPLIRADDIDAIARVILSAPG